MTHDAHDEQAERDDRDEAMQQLRDVEVAINDYIERVVIPSLDHVHYTFSVVRFPITYLPYAGVTRIFGLSNS